MFVKAVTVAAEFTNPVVISTRTRDGKVITSCGSFVLVNAEGWILTAAHIFQTHHVELEHRAAIANYEKQRKTIEENLEINAAKKRKLVNRLEYRRDWISNVSFWWGQDGVSFSEFFANGLSDIAVAKLTGFHFKPDQKFPRFGNPKTELPQGRSLCRLGFPFHAIQATFDEQKRAFVFSPGALPIPRFPLDGILTRNVNLVNGSDGTVAKFIETSTPGLKGQSGGPIFDVNGVVWGIQSQTRSLELGFQPEVQQDGKKIAENQFLNVGWGTYVSEIVKLFETAGLKYQTTD
jgi:Trypsin-like peptidase domain